MTESSLECVLRLGRFQREVAPLNSSFLSDVGESVSMGIGSSTITPANRIRLKGENLASPPAYPKDITLRTDRFTADKQCQLVYTTSVGKTSKKKFDYRWIDVESDEIVSGVYELERTATYWQEGYEAALRANEENVDE